MEPEDPLPYSREPATGPYPQPDKSSPHPVSLRSTLILYSHLRLDLPSGFFRLSSQNFVRIYNLPMRATCRAHISVFILFIKYIFV
jgi:hypothetical protein